MKIHPIDRNYVIIDTPQGSIHVKTTEQGDTEMYWNDHAHLLFKGQHKQKPLLMVDSEEYPTRLALYESETPWFEVMDNRPTAKEPLKWPL